MSGSLNQIGVNLVEGKRGNDVFEGVGQAAWMGAAIGAAVGGILGAGTGIANRRTALRLKSPDTMAGNTANAGRYANYRGVAPGNRYGWQQLDQAVQGTGQDEVLALGAHGARNDPTIQFTDAFNGNYPGGSNLSAADIITEMNGNFQARGLDLTAVCWSGQNGVARTLANRLQVPVRAANVQTWTVHATGQTYLKWYDKLFRFGTFRTYYPSQLKTGWISVFGY